MTISRKKLISLALALILLLVITIVAVQLLSKRSNPVVQNTISETKPAPAAMTTDERQKLGIGDDVQLEVINRNSDGEITTYKLIK
ncbi:MAG: hypothetical protein PHE20_04395 [Patescibacteria group bacterium]|nr:hypothetical protein [Patescibacteria group bacterium]